MSYNLIEVSQGLSEPFELYKFTRDNVVWAYTNCEEAIVYGVDFHGAPLTYLAIPIKRGEIEQNQEINKSPLKITMSIFADYLEQYKSSPPTSVTTLTVYRGHFNDSDVSVVWLGRHVNTKFSETTAELELESVFTSLRRPCLRFRYQRTCPHDLYGEGCKADLEDFVVENLELNTISGTDLTFGNLNDGRDIGYFVGGYLVWEDANYIPTRRFIISQDSLTLRLNLPIAGIGIGDSVKVYPGCNRTLDHCNSKFNNLANYGGQPYYPEKNPFAGEPIF